MRILIDIGHPGHVHFYKNIIWNLQNKGHEILISARDKEVTLDLLDHYGFDYKVLSVMGEGKFGLALEFFKREYSLYRLIKKFKPDVISELGGGIFISLLCKILKKPSIVFTDSEPVSLDWHFSFPFAKVIYTPNSFIGNIGSNHIRYNGYQELSYLHPDYYTPDPNILREIGIAEDVPYILLRFVAWKAGHDINQSGFSYEFKLEIVKTLSKYAEVLITSETPLPQELRSYGISISPHRIHDALYFATLFMGDGATMATEAGILGTPSIRSSSMALNMGNFIELMNKYKLVYSYDSPKEALNKAVSLLENKNSNNIWRKRRKDFLTDQIDVVKFVIKLFEEYAY